MNIQFSSSSGHSPILQTTTAEREANQRIQDAGKRIEQAENEANQALQNIQDSYEKQAFIQEERNELALQNQQVKGYEQIRDLQRAQQAELKKIQRNGEKDITHLNDYFNHTTRHLEETHNAQLGQIESQAQQELKYTQDSHNNELDQLKTKNNLELQTEYENSNLKIKSLLESAAIELERMKNQSEQAKLLAQDKFDENFKERIQKNTEILNDLNQRSDERIHNIQENTAIKLNSYSSSKEDPFYRLMDLKSKFIESDHDFILIAHVPEYEQEHLSVSISGDRLMISGHRRYSENSELDAGHFQGSSSFQSFHEIFPLSWPVESNQLTKEFDGDKVIIRVPKKNQYTFKNPASKRS